MTPLETLNDTTQNRWSSKLAFVLATTGAAVGLGNIWKFPYMVGNYGGSAFVFIYLISVIFIGLPIMMSEILLGRYTRKSTVDTLEELLPAHHTIPWHILGWWSSLTLLLVLSFYSVVSGWSLAYLSDTAQGLFNGQNASYIHQMWQHFLSSPLRLTVYHTLFMLLTMAIVSRGVQKGLERAARIMMPLLFFILLILVIYASQHGDFHQGWSFLFHFDLHKITSHVAIAAMGHAFFTLAIGAGCLLTYGCYLKQGISITKAVTVIAGLDIWVAIFAGLAIFPIIFVNHLTAQSGPGLLFQVLPIAFSHMPYGQWIGCLFFILLIFAALTSTISLAEPLILLLEDRYQFSRQTSCILVGISAWILGLGSVLSFNLWKHITFLGYGNFFTSITDLVTNIMLPCGGIGFCIFSGWILPQKISMKALHPCKPITYRIWFFLIRYIAPLGILTVFLSTLFNTGHLKP